MDHNPKHWGIKNIKHIKYIRIMIGWSSNPTIYSKIPVKYIY